MPTLTVHSFFALLSLHLQNAAILVPTLIFFLWNPGLLICRETNVSKRALGRIAALMALTIVEFGADWGADWREGLHYQGVHPTVAVSWINALWLTGLLLHG